MDKVTDKQIYTRLYNTLRKLDIPKREAETYVTAIIHTSKTFKEKKKKK